MRTTAIVAAGGRGRRLGAPVPKQLLEIDGRSMLEWSVSAFADHDRVSGIVVVVPAELVGTVENLLDLRRKPTRVVTGGERRQDSVARGLDAVGEDADIVLVHDAARPFVDAALIDRVIDGAAESGAAISAIQAQDTVKVAETNGDRAVWIARTLPRQSVFLAQTPQGFRRAVLRDAVNLGRAGVEATDEAFLAEQAGHRVRLVEGSVRNMKITSAEDLALAQSLHAGASSDRKPEAEDTVGAKAAVPADATRIGTGYDLHRLVDGRPLVIGGVTIPFERGLLGHSDADVLCHAITDAILGAAAAGDIGQHFPDSDERWRGASSIDLLVRAVRIVREAGFSVGNVDAVVIAEKPRLAAHVPAIVGRLSAAIGVRPALVSIKGKTNEAIGEIGRGEAIACHAVALLRRSGG